MNKINAMAVLLCVAALVGCGNVREPVNEPVPDYALSAEKLGTMQVDGCEVNVHFVEATAPAGRPYHSGFTLATAQCPTASVTATQYACGKGCNSQTVKVERTSSKSQEPSAPTKESTAKPAATAEAELSRLKAENAALKKVVGTLVDAKQ
jgi:hypothetical protein